MFSSNAAVLAELRKESLDIYNRLHSIQEDLNFVSDVNKRYPDLPLLPNLRCGAWYTDPAIANETPAYFKSTDGHTNNWSFNLRRANLHVLPLVAQRRGVILVDSTRAGKRMPDALSKTVPIWCAVVNRGIQLRRQRSSETSSNAKEWDTQLYTPPGVISAQEHHQISSNLETWANALANSSFDLPLDLIVPLRPFWITPSTTTFPTVTSTSNQYQLSFLPIICVSASKQVGTERRVAGYAYVQGSGDDHELWGMGLTPSLFWKHREELLSCSRSEIENIVTRITSSTSSSTTYTSSKSSNTDTVGPTPTPTPIEKVHGRISIGSYSPSQINKIMDFVRHKPSIVCILIDFDFESQSSTSTCTTTGVKSTATPKSSEYNDNIDINTNTLHINANTTNTTQKSKSKAGHIIHQILNTTIPFVQSHLSSNTTTMNTNVDAKKVWILEGCGNDLGTRLDLSAGVALVLIQLLFNDDGELKIDESRGQVSNLNKGMIRKRLEWIIESEPRVNPSRDTLKRVNEFLLTSEIYVSRAYYVNEMRISDMV